MIDIIMQATPESIKPLLKICKEYLFDRKYGKVKFTFQELKYHAANEVTSRVRNPLGNLGECCTLLIQGIMNDHSERHKDEPLGQEPSETIRILEGIKARYESPNSGIGR